MVKEPLYQLSRSGHITIKRCIVSGWLRTVLFLCLGLFVFAPLRGAAGIIHSRANAHLGEDIFVEDYPDNEKADYDEDVFHGWI